jgi:hypothetical protein
MKLLKRILQCKPVATCALLILPSFSDGFAMPLDSPVLSWDPLGRIVKEPSFDPFSLPEPADLAANLVDELRFLTLEQMRTARLEDSKLTTAPWSGWYFPLKDGGLAYRYADPHFPKDAQWNVIEKYILNTMGQGPVDSLSPAEKYDLLLGDPQFTLTRKMIQIASNHAVGGVVEGWLGYCTGWANAAMMLPRPRHSVTVLARDGKTRIEFRPSDIKALGALLWANGSYPTRLVGTVCQESPVRRDPLNDRALNPACQDTNPATWHLSVINQLGVQQRSFLIDSDPGFQIWNQPVSAYSYTYFNPATGKPASFAEAQVRLADFKQDKFAAHRSVGAVTVVGVEMNLTFVYEKVPDTQNTDSVDTDVTRVPVYKYDLELDSSGKIIGGEWWTRLHPDVLWVAPLGTHPTTYGDAQLQDDRSVWNPDGVLPAPWVNAAAVSELYVQPLSRIVEQLFAWSAR